MSEVVALAYRVKGHVGTVVDVKVFMLKWSCLVGTSFPLKFTAHISRLTNLSRSVD